MDHGKHGNQPPPSAPPQQAAPGTWMMGTPVAPHAIPADTHAAGWAPVEHIPSPSASAGPTNPGASYPTYATNNNRTGNPYVNTSPVPDSGHAMPTNPYVNVSSVPSKSHSETMLKVLGRCGKKLEDTTKKAGDAAGSLWHHLKTSPSLTDAALARLAQGTKVLAEGGNDKIFQQTFGIFPGEQLWKAYACYLSTSAGPVIGTLYLSTVRIAFCSDNPLCQNMSNGQQEWAYYKVVVPRDQLRAVNPSTNPRNPSEKHIQIVTMDNHEFWFMGFISYDKAVKNLSEAIQFVPHGYHPRNI